MNWEPWTGCYKASDGCTNCYFYGPHAKRYGQSTIEKTDKFDWPVRKKPNGGYRGIWGLRPSYVRRNDDVVPLEVLDKKQELGRQSARQLSDEQLKAKAEEMQSGMPRKRKASAPA